MATGIVEELFITGAAGSKSVYFRNYSVVAEIVTRATLGNVDPESVAWGPNQDRFVVRIGTDPTNHVYYIFSLPRALDVVFGPGVIPSATLVRTETPFTSAASVITLNATYSETQLAKYLALRSDLTWQNPGCIIGTVTLSATRFDASFVTTGTKGPTSFTLANLIAGGGTTIRYGLNANNELILLVTAPLPLVSFGFDKITNATKANTDFNAIANCTYGPSNSSNTVTVSMQSRGETHLWVINHTTGTVVYRTAQVSPTLAITKHTKWNGTNPPNSPLVSTQQRQVVPDGGTGCGNIDQCVAFDVAGGTVLTSDLALRDDGYEILTDHIMDSSVPYVSGNLGYTLASTDTSIAATTIGGNSYAGGAASTFKATWTNRAWADGSGTFAYQYDVENVYPVRLTTPMRWIAIIKRQQRTSGGTLSNPQHGLFLMSSDGSTFKTLRAFVSDSSTYLATTVLSCNKSHVLWQETFSAGGDQVYLTVYRLGINGITKVISTDSVRVAGEKFRLLDDTKDPDNGLLFDAREDVRIEPAGFFVSAWDAGGYPDWTIKIGEGFPLRVELTPYEKLQVVPAGITFPVTP